MTSKYTNKNGVKLLAAVAVLALAVCSFAVIVTDQVNAEEQAAVEPTAISTDGALKSALETGGNYILSTDIPMTISVSNISVMKNVTIDLNGKTINITSENNEQDGGSKKIYRIDIGETSTPAQDYSAPTVVIKSTSTTKGNINWTGFDDGSISAFRVGKGASFTLENINLTTNGTGIYANGDASHVVVKNSAITAGAYAIGTNASTSYRDYRITVDVEDSILTARGNNTEGTTFDNDSDTILLNTPNAKITVKNSTVIGDNQAAFIRCGEATFENSTIQITNKYNGEDPKTWTTGNGAASAALVVGNKDKADYAGLAKVTINGGKIIAAAGEKAIVTAAENFSNGKASTVDLTIGKNNATEVSIGTDDKAIFSEYNTTSGSFKVSPGSIIIEGTYTEDNGNITITSGTAKLKSNVPADVTITINQGTTLEVPSGTRALTVSGKIIVDGTFEDNSSNGVTIDSTGKMSVSGEVKATQTITNNGSISITSSKAVVPSTITGTGTVDASAGSTEGTISGQYSTSSKFTNTQVITVTADTYLVDNAIFTIQGTLIIPEGVTLYIQDNARLVITGQAANLKVDGNIVIESAVDANSGAGVVRAGALLIEENAKAENNGTIELSYSSVDGSVSQHPGMNITSTFVNNGQIIVGTESFLYIWGSNLTNAKDASIIIDGQIKLDEAANVIYNAGEIIIDAIIFDNNLTIELTDANAVVDIISATVKNNMQSETTVRNIVVNNGFTPSGFTKEGIESSISFGLGVDNTISGVKITPTSVLNNTTKKYNEYLVIDGALGYAVSDDATKSITITFQNVKVENELDVKAGLEITSTGTLDVDGTIMLEKESTTRSTLTISGASSLLNVDGAIVAVDGTQIISSSNGKMTISGSVQAGSDFGDLKDNTNATYYATKVGTKTTHILTTFEDAVAGVKDLSNTNTTKNVTVCGNETVSDDFVVVDSDVKVIFNNTDSKLTIGKDSVVTIADGSSITNSTAGAITVNGALIVDNKKTGDKASNAIVSDVITQTTNNNGYRIYSGLAYALENADEGAVVKLNQSVTINSSISIPKGITVDATGKGIEIAEAKTLTVNGTLSIDDVSTITCVGTGDLKAKVILNGTIKSTADNIYNKYQFAAAYYSIDNVYYAEPIESAITKIGNVYDGTIILKGEVSTGDLTIVGSADEPVVLVVTKKLTAGTITLDRAAILIMDDGEKDVTFSGTITNVNGSVKLDGTAKAAAIYSMTVDDSEVLIINGGFTAGDKKTITLSGEVVLNGFTGNNVTVLGDVTVSDDSAATKLVVEGNIAIAKQKTLITGDATVLGTMVVGANGALSINNNGKMVVGEAPTSLGANGTVTGNIVLGTNSFIKVYVGSEVSKTGSTAVITLNGVDYATVYFNETVSLRTVIGLSELQAIPGYDVTEDNYDDIVEAVNLSPTEYSLEIKALPVIIDVSVDVGTKIQLGPYFYNQTTTEIKLAVGEYTVIASALTGYSGTPVAELWIDGKKVQDIDGTITLTPEMTSKKVVIVSTFASAPGPTPTPSEPSENILVSVVSDGTGVKVYLVSLDGGYIAPGKISVKYNYTIVSPEYGPIGLDNTVEEDVTVEDISADGRTAVVTVDLSTKTGYSGITSVMAASGDFTSEKIIYTPVAVL